MVKQTKQKSGHEVTASKDKKITKKIQKSKPKKAKSISSESSDSSDSSSSPSRLVSSSHSPKPSIPKKSPKKKQQEQKQFKNFKTKQQAQKKKSEEKVQEKSYFEIINEYIKEYEKIHEKSTHFVINEKRPYCLVEDLKIIYEVAKDDDHEGLGPQFWNEIKNKKLLERSMESMRDRYKRYIRYLNKNDFNSIITYLQQEGAEGYMIFEKGPNGSRKLISIQKQDPTQKTEHSANKSHPKEKNTSNKKVKKGDNSNNEENKLYQIPEKSMQSFKKIAYNAARPVIRSNKNSLSQAIIEEIPFMKQMYLKAADSLDTINQISYKITTNFTGGRFAIEQKIHEVKDLNSAVNLIHYQFNKTKTEIINDLSNVNGNIEDLMQIYLHPNESQHLKWSEEDDEILRTCKSAIDTSLKLLIKYKGKESVKNRIKFKKYRLPFSL